MGVSNSYLAQRYDIKQLLLYIKRNDIESFRQGILSNNREDLNLLLLEAIRTEKKEFFELILDRLNVFRKLEPPDYKDPDYYEHCFVAVVHCNDPYFIFRLLELHGNTVPCEKRSLLHIAVHFQSATIAHHLILKGADVNATDIKGKTPLEEAIQNHNLELVCMLLYYDGHINIRRHRISIFTYGLLHRTSREIQELLIDYETDFNSRLEEMTTLLLAIKANSPLISEIIERGADLNFHLYENNAVSVCLENSCDPEMFRMIWENFDYKIWQDSYSKCVLLKFFQCKPLATWKEYLKILMENESKLRLDLEHHRKSYFFKSDLLICNIYLGSLKCGFDDNTAEGYVMHMLSHGAQIFTRDIDIIYNELRVCSPFLNSLVYMDLCSNDDYASFMYFKYHITPDVNLLMTNVAIYPDILLHTIEKVKVFCAFTNDLQSTVLDILGTDDPNYEKCEVMLKSSANFPSLLELTRFASRKMICHEYNIKNSCMLYTYIRFSGIPLSIQDVLLYELPIYHFDKS